MITKWYTCDKHFDGSKEEFAMTPILGKCDVCGEKATHFGPKRLQCQGIDIIRDDELPDDRIIMVNMSQFEDLMMKVMQRQNVRAAMRLSVKSSRKLRKSLIRAEEREINRRSLNHEQKPI